LSGPFVAGNDAGHAYNTWPKMLDDWVPPEWITAINGEWRMFFEDYNIIRVQPVRRYIGGKSFISSYEYTY